jgi:hypothetical protein
MFINPHTHTHLHVPCCAMLKIACGIGIGEAAKDESRGWLAYGGLGVSGF